jgi:hypothetical protein
MGIYGFLYFFFYASCFLFFPIRVYSNMKQIEVTMQEIWAVTRPIVQRNKKKYNRKPKHKRMSYE